MRDDQLRRLADGIGDAASLLRESARLQDREAIRQQGQFNGLVSSIAQLEAKLDALSDKVGELQHTLAVDELLESMPPELAEALAGKLGRAAIDKIRAAKWQQEKAGALALEKRDRDDDSSVVVKVWGRPFPVPVAKVAGFALRYVLPGSAIGAAWHYVLSWISHGR